MPSRDPALRVENVTKQYPGVRALDRVSFSVQPGEVHGLVGENGAGKSTLMGVITGAIEADSGRLYVGGDEVRFSSTRQAAERGIACIYQEFNLIPRLNVYRNMFLGRELYRASAVLDRSTMRREAQRWIDELDGDFEVETPVYRLSQHQQQLVEIARVLSMDARILVMDEPTAPLSGSERQSLYRVVEKLRDQDVTVVYVTHHLDEVFRLADRVTVLKDGEYVGTKDVDRTRESEIVRMMVGRELAELYPEKEAAGDEVLLELDDFSSGEAVRDVSFQLRTGEILGLAGVLGSGRTELVEAMFGRRSWSGNYRLEGREVEISSPREAIEHGLAFLTRDRHHDGLILEHSLTWNLSLPSLDKRQTAGIIHKAREREMAAETIKRLNIRTTGGDQEVRFLSGGNQQKTVLGKWLVTRPRILLCDEPTQGVDVGARSEIYEFLRDLTRQGLGVIVISSDLPELMGFSDRIIAMRRGRPSGEFRPEQYREEDIMAAAALAESPAGEPSNP